MTDYMKLFVFIASILTELFIVWFFFGKKDSVVSVSEEIDIYVDGGYKPSVLRIPRNKKVLLHFIRTDNNSCLEEVIIPSLSIKKYLPLHKKITLSVQFSQKGTYEFACGMNMFHGKIQVV